MTSRHRSFVVLIAALLFVATGLPFIYLGTDDSEATEGNFDHFHWVREDDNVTVTGYGWINSLPTGWNNCKTLTLTAVDGMAYIGNYVFYERNYPQNIILNGPIGSIGTYAFGKCHSLGYITVNGTVGSVGSCAFDDCTSLKNITVNGTIDSIGSEVFKGCIFLENVTVNDAIGSVGDYAFEDCDSLKTVNVGGALNSIKNHAFDDCDSLKTVNVGGALNSIGDYAFYNCDELENVTVNGAIGSIRECAFQSCHHLENVTVNGAVGLIKGSSFNYCDSLSELTITGQITTIENLAFYGCDKLTTLNINCSNNLNITTGSDNNGMIGKKATTINLLHDYSATYEWAEDGSSCIVHIVCANESKHNQDIDAEVTSTVKTEDITEYTVSGTYDGFDYSDTKEIRDPPATNNNTILYIAIGAVSTVAIAGGALLFIRSRR